MSAGVARVLRVCLALFAALAAAPGGAQPTVKLAVSRGPVSLPIYVAEARGLFAREGVAVQALDCDSGRQCFGLLTEPAADQRADQRADLATAAELVVALHGTGASQAVILATLSSSHRHIKLVARRSAGIEAAADLRGVRVGTVSGTSAQYFLDSWLLFHGIDPQGRGGPDVRSLAPAALVGALAERQLDAVAIWEPAADAAVRALGPDALVLPSARVYTQHFSLVATRDGVARHGAAFTRVLRALEQAGRLIAAEPAQALAILNRRLGVETPAATLAEHDYRLTLAQSLVSTLDAQTRWARQGGHGTADVHPRGVLRLIEPTLLRQVAPAAVTLQP